MEASIVGKIYEEHQGVRVWRICHSGFLITYRDIVLIIDPAIEIAGDDPLISEHSERIRLLKELPVLARDLRRVDIVLVSHADEDHSGSKSLTTLEQKTHVFVGTPEAAGKFRAIGIPAAKIREAYFDEPIFYGELRIIPTEAHHLLPRGCSCGYLIDTPAGRIWYPGDSIILPGHYEIRSPDILLLPIAKHVFGAEQGGRFADRIRAQHIIPCHYGTYEGTSGWRFGDVDLLKENVENPDERLHLLDLGEMFHYG